MNGFANAGVGAAAAEIGLVAFNIGVAGSRKSLQQIHRRHNLARLAVTTLGDIFLDPGLLDRVQAVTGESLNRGDLASVYTGNRRDTGALSPSPYVYSAGTAKPCTATELGAAEAGLVAQHPEQWSIDVAVEGKSLAIERELDHGRYLAVPVWQG